MGLARPGGGGSGGRKKGDRRKEKEEGGKIVKDRGKMSKVARDELYFV